jgi:hypothetical protein
MHDLDHLVHFWNPQSTCIDQKYEVQIQIQFSVFLSICYSGYPYPAKDLLIEPQKTLKGILVHLDNIPAHNSPLSSEKIGSAKAQRVPYPSYSPSQTEQQVMSFSLAI